VLTEFDEGVLNGSVVTEALLMVEELLREVYICQIDLSSVAMETP
jgi:hypothetical protein